MHLAPRLDGQKRVLKIEKEKANATVEIVFRDALGMSYKDITSISLVNICIGFPLRGTGLKVLTY